jgi:hypothetical protein
MTKRDNSSELRARKMSKKLAWKLARKFVLNSDIGKEQLQTIDQVRGGVRSYRGEKDEGKKKWDCHCWLEITDDKGTKIMDYDDEKLIKDLDMPKYCQMIRSPFNMELQIQLNKECYKGYKIAIKEMNEISEDFVKYNKDHWLNETGNCMCRCYLLQSELKPRAKELGIKQIRIVFGSLGWKDRYGRVRWEYG